MKIVFFGNCQINALFDLYNRFVKPFTDDLTVFLPNYGDLDATGIAALGSADIIIEQLLDLSARSSIGDHNIGAKIIQVPLVSAGFLWPFAGQPSIKNETTWFCPGGPYSAEMGNSFLNKLIADGVDPESGAEQFLQIDVPKLKNLDRLYELFIERQYARDAQCGIDIAPVIERYFREEALFRTPFHPNVRVTLHLAAQVFERIGVNPAAITKMNFLLRETPFPKDENPIHQSVSEHFKLQYISAQTRYSFLVEGRFYIREMSVRYMTGQWSPELSEGLHILGTDETAAYHKLVAAVTKEPDLAAGHFAIGSILHRNGDLDEAELYFERAIALDQSATRFYHGLAGMLLSAGRRKDALTSIDRALAKEPFNEHYRALRAHILAADGQDDDAEFDVMLALEMAPTDAHLHNLAGNIMRGKGLYLKALQFTRRAVNYEPNNSGFRYQLIQTLISCGEHQEAITRAEEFAATDIGDGQGWYIYGRAQFDAGLIEPATQSFNEALLRDPSNVQFLTDFGHILELKGDNAAAITAFQKCVLLRPDDAELHLKLYHSLFKANKRDLAEAELKVAIALAPERFDLQLTLAELLVLNRSSHAATMISKLLLDAPDNERARRLQEMAAEWSV